MAFISVEGAAQQTMGAMESKNTRKNDHGNASQTSTDLFHRDNDAYPQIALGWLG
jgi:hypothetical protein